MTTSLQTVEPNFPRNPLAYLDLENDFGLFGSVGIEGFAGGPEYYYWNRLRDQAEAIHDDLLKTHPAERRRPFEKKLSSKYPRIINIFRSATAIQNELRKRKETQDRIIQPRLIQVQNHPSVQIAFRPTPAELVDQYHFSLQDAARRDIVIVFFKEHFQLRGRTQLDDWKLIMERAAERRKRLEAEEFPLQQPEARGNTIPASSRSHLSKNSFWTQILVPFKACLRCLFPRRK